MSTEDTPMTGRPKRRVRYTRELYRSLNGVLDLVVDVSIPPGEVRLVDKVSGHEVRIHNIGTKDSRGTES